MRFTSRYVLSGSYRSWPYSREHHPGVNEVVGLLFACLPALTKERLRVLSLHVVVVLADIEQRLGTPESGTPESGVPASARESGTPASETHASDEPESAAPDGGGPDPDEAVFGEAEAVAAVADLRRTALAILTAPDDPPR
ncbi:hypothetical protein ACFQ0B_37610 [Nonomuraea thailandensis]